MNDREYREHAKDFAGRLRDALERKRSIKIEDLQKHSEKAKESKGEGEGE
jgi:hypothetical protein